jgi:glycosyltransferase involved in cell wall biosynthesis
MSFSVVASSPSLELSGANTLIAKLLNQLQAVGLNAEWIITGHSGPVSGEADWLGVRRFKLHQLQSTGIADVQKRQKMMLRHLEENSPCVFLPNFDFDMACAIPALSLANKAVLIMHCDDKVYYDFVTRHKNLFNAIVCVSKFLADKLRASHADLRERIVHIPFGVEMPASLAVRDTVQGRRLKVAYCGRLSFHQKRVQDLAAMINRCQAENVAAEFYIAGAGPDENEFFARIRETLAAGSVTRLGFLTNAEVLKLLDRSDVLVMTSDFEGLPVILLEAMSRGCVPLVTRTESGMDELVLNGENGFLLPVGDVTGFVAALKKLHANPETLRQLQTAAFERIRSGGFTLERAAADYNELFESLMSKDARWETKRTGKLIAPEQYKPSARILKQFKKLLPELGLKR